jgi:DNA-binding response OmpR family regulator
MDKKSLLMIDDEVFLCKIVKRNLESTGDFNVDFATNGKEGIRLAKKTQPDLILLDLSMPGIDGFAVLKTLKEDEKTLAIPVVMLTALDDEDNKIKAAGLYDADYVTKPIEAQALIARIEEVLKSRTRI